MRIDVLGEESISSQARTYAEYRLFAALSQTLDSDRVRTASLVLRRTKYRPDCEGVSCTVTVETDDGEVLRVRTTGPHPYAAINRSVERIRAGVWPGRVARPPVARAVSE
jgi:hypothetical protein